MAEGVRTTAAAFRWIAGDPSLWFWIAKAEGALLVAGLGWQIQQGGIARWLQWVDTHFAHPPTTRLDLYSPPALAGALKHEERRQRLRRSVYITFYGTLIAVVAAGVLLVAEQAQAPAMTVEWFALALAGATALVMWAGIPLFYRASLKGLHGTASPPSNRVTSASEEDLVRRMLHELETLEPATLRDIAITLMRLALDQVSGGRRYSSEDAYLKYLSEAVGRLKSVEGAQVLALCAKKSWESFWVNEYWKANKEAAEAGLGIKRVFLDVDEKVNQAAQRQADVGIFAYVVGSGEIETLSERARTPSDVGFAILESPDEESRVLVHSGLGTSAVGVLIQSREVVEQFRTIFYTGARLGRRLRPSVHPPSPNHAEQRAAPRKPIRELVHAVVNSKPLPGLLVECSEGGGGLGVRLPQRLAVGLKLRIDGDGAARTLPDGYWQIVHSHVVDTEQNEPKFFHGLRLLAQSRVGQTSATTGTGE